MNRSTNTPSLSSSRTGSLGGGLAKLLTIAVIVFLGGMFLRATLNGGSGGGGSQAIPASFAGYSSLQPALADAAGGPVLAFATADWCGPCQTFKKGALADEQFANWITQNGVKGVYLDSTSGHPDADKLGVQAIPTLVFFRDGKEVARNTGGMSTTQLIAWLERANKS